MNSYYVDRRLFTSKAGWMTNSLGLALSTYITLDKSEYSKMLDETRFMIKMTLKVISLKTVADSFNVNVREIVRILRWDEGKKYKRPFETLLKEINSELLEDFA